MIYVSKDEGELYFNLLESLDGGQISEESMDRLEEQAKYSPEQEVEFQNLPKKVLYKSIDCCIPELIFTHRHTYILQLFC